MSGHSKNGLRFYLSFLVWMLCGFLLTFSPITPHPVDNKKGKTKPIPSQLNVYMDGSKTRQGAGSGYVILKGKGDVLHTLSINLTGDPSIFQSELIAIQEEARHLTVNETHGGYTLSSVQTHEQPYRL